MIDKNDELQSVTQSMEDLEKASELLKENCETSVHDLTFFNSSTIKISEVFECQNSLTKLSNSDIMYDDSESSLAELSTTSVNDIGILPEATHYGQVKLKKSDRNHVGPKYIAEKLTVVNNLPNNRKERIISAMGLSCCFTFCLLFLLLYLFIHLDSSNHVQNNNSSISNNTRNYITDINWKFYMFASYDNKTLGEPDHNSMDSKNVKKTGEKLEVILNYSFFISLF